MNRVFVDTSALFAALVANDSHHEAARKGLEAALEQRDARLVTTSLVLLETMALLQARVGLDAALAFDAAIRPLLEVVWVDKALYDGAVRRLQLRRSRKVSLVDCASFVHMEGQGISHALAFDRHFEDEGFQLL
jgi:predicted nucleic acid-binding protein